MFFRKSVLETDEYKTLLRRYTELEARVLSLETSNTVFRDKVLRKVQKQREEMEEPEQLNSNKQGGLLRGNLRK